MQYNLSDIYSVSRILIHAADRLAGHRLEANLRSIASELQAEARTAAKAAAGAPEADPAPAGTPAEPDLAAIFREEGSDKTTRHRYQQFYIEELSRFQGLPSRILEIGVKGGASLRAMHRLLPDAELFGVDIRSAHAEGTPGTIIQADAYSGATWEKLPHDLDLLIDDGSHKLEDMLRGLPYFLTALKPGGTLIIEDVPTEDAGKVLQIACPGSEIILTPPHSDRHDDRIFRFRKPGPAADLMIPLGTGSPSGNDELRLLLRSVEKYCSGLGKIYVAATQPPAWLTGVEIVPVPDRHTENKDANLIDKFCEVCRISTAETIVRMSDDQIFLAPCDLRYLPVFCRGKAPADFAGTKWSKRMVRTGEFLAAAGHPLAVSYDTHCPQPFRREQVIPLLRNVDYATPPGYCINTLLMGLRGCTWGAHYSAYKSTLEEKAETYDLTKRFAGYMDGAFLGGLRTKLFELFPDPSKFEKC